LVCPAQQHRLRGWVHWEPCRYALGAPCPACHFGSGRCSTAVGSTRACWEGFCRMEVTESDGVQRCHPHAQGGHCVAAFVGSCGGGLPSAIAQSHITHMCSNTAVLEHRVEHAQLSTLRPAGNVCAEAAELGSGSGTASQLLVVAPVQSATGSEAPPSSGPAAEGSHGQSHITRTYRRFGSGHRNTAATAAGPHAGVPGSNTRRSHSRLGRSHRPAGRMQRHRRHCRRR
jgi:hypothetical protein